MRLLGDYAVATPTETFMKRNGEQISNDIARLVTATEAEQGKRLREPLIKQITGNDTMTARFFYGEFFDWGAGSIPRRTFGSRLLRKIYHH
jgi:putative DNA primase/helicase